MFTISTQQARFVKGLAAASMAALLLSSVLPAQVRARETKPPITPANPTQLALVYQEPQDGRTGQALTTLQVAGTFGGPIIYDRRRLGAHWTEYIEAGVDPNQFQLYIALSHFPAPKAFQGIDQEERKCTSAEKTFQPKSLNRITMEPGDFCDIQQSRLDKTPFDHDLSETDNDSTTSTARVVATKDWFLLDLNDHFIQSRSASLEYSNLVPNPGNASMREYYNARLRREFYGGKTKDGKATWSVTGARRLYLDNIDLSLARSEEGLGQDVKQYSSDDVYAQHILDWVKQIRQRLGSQIGVWGNLTSPKDNAPGWWQKYSAVLDGAMGESLLSSFWGYRPRTPDELARDISKVDIWQKAGKALLLADMLQSNGTSVTAEDLRYSWATFMATTGGINATYAVRTRGEGYGGFFAAEENYSRLGKPGSRTITNNAAGHPIKITRTFECGKVTADVINFQGTVTLNSTANCRTYNFNPGFESDTEGDGKPDYWSPAVQAAKTSTIQSSGSSSLSLQASGNQTFTVWQAVYQLRPGTAFDVGAKVNIPRTSDRFTFTLAVAWKDINSTELRVDTIKSWSAATSGWNQGTKALTAPPGTDHAVIRLAVTDLAATIYVDDVVFRTR